jgi:4-hydroxybenzoate polyprenyltransferase
MRLDRPIGTWLLLFPCWWSLAMAPRAAGYGWGDLYLAFLFAVGALVMRGAGCTVNDLWDRDIDAKVARTRTRPIASGAISVPRALAFLAVQLAIGLAVLVQFNWTTIWLGALSLLLVIPYPLMKRITWWPQAFLGLTFNWGALVGWTAATGEIAWPPAVLYAAAVCWTIGYDTIYAHQDKDDDVKIGVKSTALLFGRHSRAWIAGFYGAALAGMTAAGAAAGLHWIYLVGLTPAALHLARQVARWAPDDHADCLARFRSNRWFGALVLLAFLAGRALAG